jgi:N-acetyl-anhydromuramyl-L-alanine amidase AmpD
MKIIQCLLDENNQMSAGGSPISTIIRNQGKKHLWENRPSPFIDTVVIHYISARDLDARRKFNLALILKIFCDLGVSSHYLITRGGRVLRLVPEEKKAWHAGGSIMPSPDSRKAVNNFSIGIELVATPDSGFTEKQYASCAGLCRNIQKRYGIRLKYIGHQHIAGKKAVKLGLRGEEKTDPGPKFDWKRLRKAVAS